MNIHDIILPFTVGVKIIITINDIWYCKIMIEYKLQFYLEKKQNVCVDFLKVRTSGQIND